MKPFHENNSGLLQAGLCYSPDPQLQFNGAVALTGMLEAFSAALLHLGTESHPGSSQLQLLQEGIAPSAPSCTKLCNNEKQLKKPSGFLLLATHSFLIITCVDSLQRWLALMAAILQARPVFPGLFHPALFIVCGAEEASVLLS